MLSFLSGHPYLQQPSTQKVIQGLIGKWNDYYNKQAIGATIIILNCFGFESVDLMFFLV